MSGAAVGYALQQGAHPHEPSMRALPSAVPRRGRALHHTLSRISAVVPSGKALRLAADVPVAGGVGFDVPALHRWVVQVVVGGIHDYLQVDEAFEQGRWGVVHASDGLPAGRPPGEASEHPAPLQSSSPAAHDGGVTDGGTSGLPPWTPS